MADGVTVDFPGDVPVAVVVVTTCVDGTTLGKRAYERTVAGRGVWTGNAGSLRCTDTVLRRIGCDRGGVVHHECAVILSQSLSQHYHPKASSRPTRWETSGAQTPDDVDELVSTQLGKFGSASFCEPSAFLTKVQVT